MQELIKFDGIKMEFDLEAQMPMIHYQSEQKGATLRATEVKPKLDAYLMLMEKGLKKEDLNYKMQITLKEMGREVNPEVKTKKIMPNGKEKTVTDVTNTYSMYYGNMGDAKKKYCLFTNPTITILCFKENIRNLLEKHIVNFFLVTNFGTMQNKGFGSFIPKGWCKDGNLSEDKKKEVAKLYEALTDGACYAMDFGNMTCKTFEQKNEFCVKMSNTIKLFYGVMKSGANYGQGRYARSYIYQYGHNKLKLGNEKAWMKKQKIAPTLYRPGNEKKHEYGSQQDFFYLRAFLGIGDSITYGDGYNQAGFIQKNPGVTINIASKDEKFKRLSSPIYFKVIRNIVFVAAFNVPEELYGAEFKFTGKKEGVISVPTKEDGNKPFDIHEFLKEYVKYYNTELDKSIKKNNYVVKEVKTNG